MKKKFEIILWENLERKKYLSKNLLESNKEKFIYKSNIREETLNLKHDDFITIIDINVDFLRVIDYNRLIEEEEDSLEKLLYIFVSNDIDEIERLALNDRIMKEVRDKIIEITEGEDGNLYYDREALLKLAAQEEIREMSLEQGRNERNKEIAHSLLTKGMSIEEISEITGLKINEIQELK